MANPRADLSRFRLVDADLSIDLYNPHRYVEWGHDLSELLRPTSLGGAGNLGRPDVTRRLLAQGADPNMPDADGSTPLVRTVAAFVTTDLHLEVVRQLIDAGAIVYADDVGALMAETVRSDVDLAIQELLGAHARPERRPRSEPPANFDDVTPCYGPRRP